MFKGRTRSIYLFISAFLLMMVSYFTNFTVYAISGEVNKPVVLSFTGQSHTNPYTEVTMYADFSCTGQSTRRLYAYWDGGTTWKIRFTPPAAGTWTYDIAATGDSTLNGLPNGQVIATDSGAKGFIIRDPNNTFAFKRTTGEHVFMMGDTNWNSMSTVGGALPYSIYQQYIDARASQKFNFVRSYVVPFYSTPTDNQHYNEGGRAFEPWNPDNLNSAYFQYVDQRIEYAISKGITMNLLVGGDQTLLTTFFGWGNGKMERWIRYLVARYGAYDICWEGRAEFEDQGSTTPGYVTLAESILDWIDTYDPYDHVNSMHTTNSCNELGNNADLDWIMHQRHGNLGDEAWDLITSDRSYNKPVMNEEYYYENSGAGATHEHHVDAETVRKGTYKVMTAGAAGLAFGNTGTYNSRSMSFAGIQYATSTGANYMTYLYNFWSATSFWKLAPPPGSTSSDLVRWPSNEYVAYFETGGTRSIYIDSGNYKYRWYNTQNGTYTGWTNFSSSGANRNFTAPDSTDKWLLQVVKDTGGSTEVTLYPTADSYVQESSAGANYGTDTTILVRDGVAYAANGGWRYTFVKFDLSSIPAGKTIDSVVLRLNCSTIYQGHTDSGIKVYKITSSWTETGVTYINKPSWSGSYEASTAVTSTGWKEWTITTLGSSWYSGAVTNYGVTVAAQSGGWLTFDSRESANDPQLVVTYH